MTLYVVIVTAFLAAPYSNVMFLLVGFLTLQWVLCTLWTLANVRGVTAELSELPPVPAGAPTSIAATLRAPGRTRFQVTVELELEDGTRIAGALACLAREGRLELELPALPRGVHAVRRCLVSSSYPLGVMRARRVVPGPRELVVYPQPSALVTARSGSRALAELLGSNAAGAGDLQPSSLRDHRDGDELRSVHWRATARRGSLVVREWEGGGGEGLEVVLDRRAEPEALEAALELLSALAQLARTNKELLALTSQGLQATYGDGHRPWSDALRYLAAAEALPADGPPPPPVSPSVTRLPLAAGHVHG